MIYASNIVKEKGIDGLKKEIEMRGVYRVPLTVKAEQFILSPLEFLQNRWLITLTVWYIPVQMVFGITDMLLILP